MGCQDGIGVAFGFHKFFQVRGVVTSRDENGYPRTVIARSVATKQARIIRFGN